MKRYEKLSKEEIIAQLNGGCESCIVVKVKGNEYRCNTCMAELSKVLNEEVEMIPRAWKFKTAEEARTAFMEYCAQRACIYCKYFASKNNGTPCELKFLYEEVEK